MKSRLETMSEHLERETLSALMDEPGSDPVASAHLEACPACSREFEVMRRMRMALSAMGQLEPPDGAWNRIEARLPRTSRVERWLGVLVGDGWVAASLRAAAAVVLFAGGVALGLRAGGLAPAGLASTSGTVDSGSVAAGGSHGQFARSSGNGGPAGAGEATVHGSAALAGREVAGLALASAGDGVTDGSSGSVSLPANLPEPYRAMFSRLEALRMQGPSPTEALRDPQAAAQHLARLDALIRASREAVRQMPADPAVNDFLFQVVAERNELDRVLHVASLEYH
ncbi:MAG: hypothetical protein Q8W47_05250 [Candidatus Palauibacterales bacterium]|nr:hypothetical protein [Candidatus Palauibacterales bacterium]